MMDPTLSTLEKTLLRRPKPGVSADYIRAFEMPHRLPPGANDSGGFSPLGSVLTNISGDKPFDFQK